RLARAEERTVDVRRTQEWPGATPLAGAALRPSVLVALALGKPLARLPATDERPRNRSARVDLVQCQRRVNQQIAVDEAGRIVARVIIVVRGEKKGTFAREPAGRIAAKHGD